MKGNFKKSLGIALLALIAGAGMTGCGKQRDTRDPQIKAIYELAQEAGYTGTYEDWLESVKGKDGVTPTITIDPTTKHWIINGTDTGVVAEGKDGEDGENGQNAEAPTIAIDPTSKHWIINGVDTGIVAEAKNGEDGQDAVAPTITIDPETKHWIIGEVDTGVVAEGQQGEQGQQGQQGKPGTAPVIEIGENGNWIIDGEDTNVSAVGADGKQGEDGEAGLSAYEIFMKHFPEYKGDEAQWMRDFVQGKLDLFTLCKHPGAKIENSMQNKTTIKCPDCGEQVFDSKIIGVSASALYSFFEYKGAMVGILTDGWYGNVKDTVTVTLMHGDETNLFAVGNLVKVTTVGEEPVTTVYKVKIAPNGDDAMNGGFSVATDDDLFEACDHIGAKTTFSSGKLTIKCDLCGEHTVDGTQIGISWADYYDVITVGGKTIGLHHTSSGAPVDKVAEITVVSGSTEEPLKVGNVIKATVGDTSTIYQVAKNAVYGGLVGPGPEAATVTLDGKELVIDGFGGATYNGKTYTYEKAFGSDIAHLILTGEGESFTVAISGTAATRMENILEGDAITNINLKNATYSGSSTSYGTFTVLPNGLTKWVISSGGYSSSSYTYTGACVKNVDGTYTMNLAYVSGSTNYTKEFTFTKIGNTPVYKAEGNFTHGSSTTKSTYGFYDPAYTVSYMKNSDGQYLTFYTKGEDVSVIYSASSSAFPASSQVATITMLDDKKITDVGCKFKVEAGGVEVIPGATRTDSYNFVSAANAGTFTREGQPSLVLDGFAVYQSTPIAGVAKLGEETGTYTYFIKDNNHVMVEVVINETKAIYELDADTMTYGAPTTTISAANAGTFEAYEYSSHTAGATYNFVINEDGTAVRTNNTTIQRGYVEISGQTMKFIYASGTSTSYTNYTIVEEGVFTYSSTMYTKKPGTLVVRDSSNTIVLAGEQYYIYTSSAWKAVEVEVTTDSPVATVGVGAIVHVHNTTGVDKIGLIQTDSKFVEANMTQRKTYNSVSDVLFTDGFGTAAYTVAGVTTKYSYEYDKTYTGYINLTRTYTEGEEEKTETIILYASGESFEVPAKVEIPFIKANVEYKGAEYKTYGTKFIINEIGVGKFGGTPVKATYNAETGIVTFNKLSDNSVAGTAQFKDGLMIVTVGTNNFVNVAYIEATNADSYVTKAWNANFLYSVVDAEGVTRYFYAATGGTYDAVYAEVKVTFTTGAAITDANAVIVVSDMEGNVIVTLTHGSTAGAGNGKISKVELPTA